MKSFLSLIALSVALNGSFASACSCIAVGKGFFDTVRNHNAKVETDKEWKDFGLTIAIVKIDRHYHVTDANTILPSFMNRAEATVTNLIQGKISSKRITIIGGSGNSCSLYTSVFPVGTTWMLALGKEADGASYHVSLCGTYAQQVLPL